MVWSRRRFDWLQRIAVSLLCVTASCVSTPHSSAIAVIAKVSIADLEISDRSLAAGYPRTDPVMGVYKIEPVNGDIGIFYLAVIAECPDILNKSEIFYSVEFYSDPEYAIIDDHNGGVEMRGSGWSTISCRLATSSEVEKARNQPLGANPF